MRRPLSATDVSRAQGLFNVLGGAWPIASLRSFEWVYGKKSDIFLQRTVGGLLFSIGYVQLTADPVEEIALGRRLGIATALTLLAVDLVYIPKRDMRTTYVQDAVCEIAWIVAWLRSER